jgi:hypothetical protein
MTSQKPNIYTFTAMRTLNLTSFVPFVIYQTHSTFASCSMSNTTLLDQAVDIVLGPNSVAANLKKVPKYMYGLSQSTAVK